MLSFIEAHTIGIKVKSYNLYEVGNLTFLRFSPYRKGFPEN